jgi:hypothetical protein
MFQTGMEADTRSLAWLERQITVGFGALAPPP